MKQSIKTKLEQAQLQPSYEFHQAVEDALDRLPPMGETKSSLRRPLMFVGAAAALIAIALPLGMWRLSAGRPDTRKTLSDGGRLTVPTDKLGEISFTETRDPYVALGLQPGIDGPVVPIPTVIAPDEAVPMPRVIQIQTDDRADRARENAFFEDQFPGHVLSDPGIQIDGMTLALRGLRLSDDKQSVMIGVLLYGEGMSHQLVADHERLNSLYPREIALDGEWLRNEGTEYPHSDLMQEETGSGTCYLIVAPLGGIAPRDALIPIRIGLQSAAALPEPMPSLAVMANLLTGEVRLPKDDSQREEWLDQSYPPIERALRGVDPSPRYLDILAPLGKHQLRLVSFAFDGKQGAFGVILDDRAQRNLTLKQLYANGQSQLTTPLKPSQSIPLLDGSYGYVFTLPLDPAPDPYGAKHAPGYYSYLIPLFQLGDDQQLMAVSYFEMDNTYYVQDASSDAPPDELLRGSFPDANGFAWGYAVRYDITDQSMRWALPDGLTIRKVTHQIGSIELEVEGINLNWTAELRLNREPLLQLPSEEGYLVTLRFFTDQMPGRLPDGTTLSLTLYPPDEGEPVVFPDIQLQIEDAMAEVDGNPVECYYGTGIGQPYEQISASFRNMGVNPRFIGAAVNVGQMRVTLAELMGDITVWAGVLVEGAPELLPHGALAFEGLRIDGTPTELTNTSAHPKYADGAGHAYLCAAYGEGVDDPIPAAQDGKPHRIELDFKLNGEPFTIETYGLFTGTGFVPQ